ncbi:MAG: thymidylate synthase (FAD) [[Chlorobium] sp. 445]|nr:MAG: thymidylate synthase (FAD) [[Chlorobium] sp. 445]
MHVRLISITAPLIKIEGKDISPEGLIAYCARVSSPNQENPDYAKLLRFCIRQKHWSIFEMVDMTVEITTTRAIAPQILRHRSFSFQEFSQRYAKVMNYELYDARRQDEKNRQNSLDDFDEETKAWFRSAQEEVVALAFKRYEEALAKGIAKECARSLLPLNTETRLYMKGSVRSWIHYLQVRCDPATQKEHRDIANAIREIFIEQFPIVSSALEWKKQETPVASTADNEQQ